MIHTSLDKIQAIEQTKWFNERFDIATAEFLGIGALVLFFLYFIKSLKSQWL